MRTVAGSLRRNASGLTLMELGHTSLTLAVSLSLFGSLCYVLSLLSIASPRTSSERLETAMPSPPRRRAAS